MTLEPKLPPGRANRKALRFAIDIRRLRQAGYTFSAIQRALLDAGVDVSLTTIKREAARKVDPTAPPNAAPKWPHPHAPEGPGTPQSPKPLAPLPTLPRGATGRELAEAFFNAHPCNPLLRTKDSP